MIHSKNHNDCSERVTIAYGMPAFTLVEALIALTIMGLVLTPVFVAQSSIFQSVIQRSHSVERMIQAQKFLIEARRAAPKDSQQFTLEKKTTKPTTVLKYELKELPKSSSIQKIPNLCIEQVTLQWQEHGKQMSSVIIGYLLRPKSAKA